MATVKAYGCTAASGPIASMEISRREPGPRDIEIEIIFSGICHSDIHQARNEWGNGVYPMVPGHEIAGRVTRTGKKVSKFKAGDLAGVGCMVDSCRKCAQCKAKREQFCTNTASFTYNGFEQDKKTPTYGGYSRTIVVDEAFALKIAKNQPLERVAPLLCAGITTYAPLKRYGAAKDKRVGVMGLGGLGHMAVKLAAAMGAEVTVLSHSPSKKTDAQRLGAHAFELISDPAAATALAGRFDLIVDTVSAPHDLNSAIGWLAVEGTLALVGAPSEPLPIAAFSLLLGQKKLAGSLIGGIAKTQEMLDFCARKKVYSDVEVISAPQIDAAYGRMIRGDVRYRFSIDASTF